MLRISWTIINSGLVTLKLDFHGVAQEWFTHYPLPGSEVKNRKGSAIVLTVRNSTHTSGPLNLLRLILPAQCKLSYNRTRVEDRTNYDIRPWAYFGTKSLFFIEQFFGERRKLCRLS